VLHVVLCSARGVVSAHALCCTCMPNMDVHDVACCCSPVAVDTCELCVAGIGAAKLLGVCIACCLLLPTAVGCAMDIGLICSIFSCCAACCLFCCCCCCCY
jgi:hypothetical protein